MTINGIAVVLVSHDIDFCSENADVCGLLFDGEMAGMQSVDDFFQTIIFIQQISAECFQTCIK